MENIKNAKRTRSSAGPIDQLKEMSRTFEMMSKVGPPTSPTNFDKTKLDCTKVRSETRAGGWAEWGRESERAH